MKYSFFFFFFFSLIFHCYLIVGSKPTLLNRVIISNISQDVAYEITHFFLSCLSSKPTLLNRVIIIDPTYIIVDSEGGDY
jgi:hypothetical protein